MRSIYLSSLAVGILSSAAFAVPTVNGTRDAEYGSALAVQSVQTGFGDANPNNGSELDAAYGRIDGGRLYLMLTGNIEANFNKLEIFIDTVGGGQAIFDSSGNDNASVMDGLVFDTGFTANYHVIARRGSNRFDLDFANLGAQTASGYMNILGGSDAGSGSTGTGVNASAISVGYDNSNIAGITGGTGAADQAAAAAVTTGFEISISLADLNYVAGDSIKVMVGQNNGDHNYWSNQFLGGMPAGTGNLGGDEAGGFTGEGAINLNNFAGNQFFTVAVPEPTSLALVAMAGAVFGRRRR